MRAKVASPEGQKIYRRRKCIPEPVFGQIEQAMGFRRFSMRGMDSAKREWALICSCHNVRKLWAARRADRLGVGVGRCRALSFELLMVMTMHRRLQIPIGDPELGLVRAAATRAGLPLAEWARNVLFEEARRELEALPDPHDALTKAFALEAPIDDLDVMIAESLDGRLR